MMKGVEDFTHTPTAAVRMYDLIVCRKGRKHFIPSL